MSIARRRGVGAALMPPVPFTPGIPYRGIFDGDTPLNAASKLSIPTTGGGALTGAMHPDVLDFGVAGFGGYRYWMAMTPYDWQANTEVPSVVATNDITNGGTWVVPTGYTNPITADPVGTTHMADTDLVYDASTGRLHVLYVTTDESTFNDIRGKYTTGDGTWSSETTVLAGTAYLNPSVIKTDTGWRLYYSTESADTLYYRDSTTAPNSGYGAEQIAGLSLDFGIYSRELQNINAVKDTDGSVVIIIGDAVNTLEGRLYFARSTDGGANFTITGPPVLSPNGSTAWDAGGIYRASLLVDTTSTVVTSGDNVHLWYSAYQAHITGAWGTGYVQIPRAFLAP